MATIDDVGGVPGGAVLRSFLGVAHNDDGSLLTAAVEAAVGGSQALAHAVVQTAHGFTVGQVVRFNGSAYVLAEADSAADADVVGLVSAVANTNDFTVQSGGYITGLSGLTAGDTYFLDPATAGALTATAPVTAGQVWKPILLADSTTSAYIINIGVGLVIPSSAQTRMVVKLTNDATVLTVTEGVFAHVVTSDLNGLSLVGVILTCTTVASATVTSVGVRKGASTEMLSTNVTIDVGEVTSETAATPAVINAANAGVATGDVVNIDCDTASASAKGFEITLVFG